MRYSEDELKTLRAVLDHGKTGFVSASRFCEFLRGFGLIKDAVPAVRRLLSLLCCLFVSVSVHLSVRVFAFVRFCVSVLCVCLCLCRQCASVCVCVCVCDLTCRR